jgi:putative ABC transport system permease protein
MLGTIWLDVRYAARSFLKSPGFTLVALIAIALGIGANTAIFSVVNAVLLRALPYRDAGRLVAVWEDNRPRHRPHNVDSPANFVEWQQQAQSFDGMAAFYDARLSLTGAGDPVEIPAQVATANLFSVLGAEAELGRTFTPEEGEPGHDAVVVISHGFWLRRFGGARDVVGKTVALNGHNVTIIGVMPADFKWFIKENSLGGKPADLWTPTKIVARSGRFLSAVARLKPNVTFAQAQAEMTTIASRLEQQRPEFDTGWGVTLVPVREQLAGEIKTPLLILLGAVAFVLLIACANVANLMLARAASRSKEIAIRAALGAGRWRVVRQLLTESLMLALAGGVVGLLLAEWGVAALVALSPPNLFGASEVGVSLPVLGFTFGVSLLTGVVFGLLPALEASRFDPNEALKESGRGNTGGARSRRARSAFVVAQVALALVLLVGAGLMIKSFARLQSVDPGFDAKNLLTLNVLLPASKYKEEPKRVAFFRQAVERIKALPGVRSVAVVSELPFAALGSATDFNIEGRPEPPRGEEFVTDVRAADENYFRTMNIPILNGRAFTPQEGSEDRHVAIINETLARKYFAGENPIGKRIVGVVGDARYDKLETEPRAMVYWTHPQLAGTRMMLVVRADNDPLNLAPSVEREIQAIDKDQPVADVRTMESWLGESVARARFGTLLLAVFACLALLLAAVGIYGVMAYTVAQRQHEIGIRMALGAQTRDVLRMIVRQGMMMTLIGVALGLAGGLALTRVISGLLFGVSATDPLTFAGVATLLIAVSLVACLVPARRATRVDPMIALRYE